MRLKLFLASIITALLTASLSSVALAGGPDATNLDLTPSAATAIADNSATITFSLFSYEYLCSGSSQTNVTSHDASGCTAQGYPNATKEAVCYNVPEDISVSGSGNTLSATSVIPDPNGTCKASFTLRSSAAGTKTVHVQNEYWPTQEFTDATVTFTAPPVKPAPAPSAPAAHTTTTAPSTPKPPASPSLDTLKVGNEQQTENAADTSSTTTVKQGQPLVL
ncbi:MAG TPA: hypothetical protein VFH39_01575, partial [Candidatus Saccharimonadales bacterium]|nr:hypothetical protein [Candidatus Saccharimonadales bacterium]